VKGVISERGAVSAAFGAGVREGRKVAPCRVGRKDWYEAFRRTRYPNCLRREIFREPVSVSDALSDTEVLVSSCIYVGCNVMLHCNYLLFTFFFTLNCKYSTRR